MGGGVISQATDFRDWVVDMEVVVGMGGGFISQATDFRDWVVGLGGGCGAGRLARGVILMPVDTRAFILLENSRSCIGDRAKEEESVSSSLSVSSSMAVSDPSLAGSTLDGVLT